MVDTLKALKEDMLAFIDPGVAEDDIEHTVSVEHHNFLRWFDVLDRLSAQQQPDRKQISETGKELPENAEQPMNNADVSVDELADWLLNNFSLNADHKADARALLARYRIERLDRLASGRRG